MPDIGLLLHHKCNENTTTTFVEDFSGNDYDAICSKNTDQLSNPGKLNNCFYIGNNVNDYLTLDSRAFQGLYDFTFCCWVYLAGLNSLNTVVSTSNGTDHDYFTIFYDPPNDRWAFTLTGGGAKYFTDNSIEDMGWHFIAAQRYGSTLYFYIDDKRLGSVSSNNNKLVASTVIIGQEQDSDGGGFAANQALYGYIDDIRLYDRVLNAIELAKIRNEVEVTNAVGPVKTLASHFGQESLLYQLNTDRFHSVIIPKNDDLVDMSQDCTLEVMFSKYTLPVTYNDWIISSRNGAFTPDIIVLQITVRPDATMSFTLRDANGVILSVVSSEAIVLRQENHVAMVWDVSEKELSGFINGRHVGTVTDPSFDPSLCVGPTDLRIGDSTNNSVNYTMKHTVVHGVKITRGIKTAYDFTQTIKAINPQETI